MSEQRHGLSADTADNTVHVYPVEPENELHGHRLDGFCWCQPTYEDVGVDGRLFIHREFIDGPVREAE